ncbi:acyl-CoA thioesterase II [Candidozyma auris]|uniref:acyl-CoA_thioesterase_II n=1 Tax=Candidozyma auris TaxID=498019 RepID=UPI000C68EB7C|nr:acyl-CoA_thioesterase_II [[Candida] auris]PIS53575.1 acyl-CoA thioesterase II [[Candida] auris]PSK78835.1 acyl-CoA thioesterase II [[Candida] auris]QEL58870.1 acyl-CoA thioesterase II [[Candida] auris]QEO20890.1 acyl-CoA_thioesterase_II [[Candida] auris]QRG36661.1 acyl-CoA thioesterase II [[Candida] auris]
MVNLSDIYAERMTDFEDALGIKQVKPDGDTHVFVSNHRLTKPSKKSKGVYGGNLAGQALLAAIRTAPEGFTPHSLHSHFVKSVSDQHRVKWTVEEISNGKTFCNRSVKAWQDKQIRYIANISLTRKNCFRQSEREYYEYEERQEQKKKEAAARGEEYDPDDDGEPIKSKPFSFQTPLPRWLLEERREDMAVDKRSANRYIYHKIPHQFVSLEDTKYEDKVPVTERKMSFFVRLGDGNLKIKDSAFQFVGLGVLSDSLFLTRLARVLRISTVNLNQTGHYFSVSLDHIIYFHDSDFDCTQWVAFGFKAVRLINNRVLLEAEMYNEAGQHVATIIQEGLVHFNGLEKQAHL